MPNDHLHPVFAKLLNSHRDAPMAAHNLAAAVENADEHAAKHAERFPETEHPILRESDGSAIDAALRGDEPGGKVRAEIERLEKFIWSLTVDTRKKASETRPLILAARKSIHRLRAHLTAAVVALLLVLPAFFPASSPKLDLSLPSIPHDAGKQAPTQPGVKDDAWGGLSFWA